MFGNINIKTEVVNGVCPTCSLDTLLVSVARDLFRCITCGSDLKQHINGKISSWFWFTKEVPVDLSKNNCN